jgi:hypothetical protein
MANERRDYLVAFCIGAVVGIGTAILLSSPGQKRLGRPVGRGSKRFRKRGRRLRRLAGR